MKSIKYLSLLVLSIFIVYSCTPDEFEGAKESGIPTIGGRQIVLEVDQETNTATFTLTGDMKGCYPVWYLDESEGAYSILPTASYTSLSAGEHILQVRLMNRNGISQGMLETTFAFNETKVDYSVYFSRLCDKEWRIDNSEKGHLGCGESGSDGSNWYSAGANEKADLGIYDNRISFTHTDTDESNGGTYHFSPGEAGTIYVNIDCTWTQPLNGETEDYNIPAEEQSTPFTLSSGEYNGEDCLYIQFASQAYLPYIPNDDIWNDPFYRVESLTNTRLAIVCDNGEITWRMVFTSREAGDDAEEEVVENSFDWDISSDSNLWKTVESGESFLSVSTWFADAGWAELPNQPTYDHSDNVWSLTIPEGMGGDQWQGQFQIHTSLTASATQSYNFYLVIDADNDMPNVTVKLTHDGDGNDGNYLTYGQYNVEGGKSYVFKAENITLLEARDADLIALVFDFAGATALTNVKISQIYFAEATGYDDDRNLWKAVDEGTAFNYVSQYFTDNNWSELGNAEYTHEGSVWTIYLPEGLGGTQWQGQFQIHTTIPADMTASYTFSCNIKADDDLSNVTIKLTDDANDGNYFFDDRHDFVADRNNTYKASGAVLSSGSADALNLVFDFGGSPGGTTVEISDIIFYKE